MADLDCDTVVIGSGAGGLAAAVALAQAGQRVRVLEQHYVPGGHLHSFHLGGFRFSPGVHYLGQLGAGGELRKTLEGLGVARHLTLLELNRDGYDHVRWPGGAFDFCAGPGPLAERLAERYSADRRGLREYLGLVERVCGELVRVGEARGVVDTLALPWRTRHLGRYGLFSLQRTLEARVAHPEARALLGVQCGDHGLAPSQVPFALHAAVVGHYLDGGCYPMGGGAAVARAFVRELERAGGQLHLETPVKRLLVEKGRVLGVELQGGRQLRSRAVVSNADPLVTYGTLAAGTPLPASLERKLGATQMSTSSLGLYLAVDMDLRGAGLDSGNYWLCRTLDAESTYRRFAHPGIAELPLCLGLFLSCTTLKDPSSFDGRHHVLEAFTFVPYAAFERWAGTPLEARPPEYVALKERLASQMIDLIETLLPGLRRSIVFQSVSSPLTNAHYCGSTAGAIYGTAKVRSQVGPWAFSSKSPLEGLWLCGASTLGHGVHGASLSGLATAAKLLGARPSELLGQPRGSLNVLPADDLRAWPPELVRTVQARQRARAQTA